MKNKIKLLLCIVTTFAVMAGMFASVNFNVSADVVVLADYAQNTWDYGFTMGTNAFSDTGTLKRDVSEISDNYIFHNGSNQAVSGYLIIMFSEPISDYNIVTGESENGSSGALKYEYSSNGTTYTEFTPEKEKNTTFGYSLNGSWNAYYYNNYGEFERTDNVKYVKITLNPTGSMAKLPFFRFMMYNFAPASDYVRPSDYAFHTWDYPLVKDENAFSAGTLLRNYGEIGDFYIFHDASSKAVPGYFIVEFDEAITDYNIVTLESVTGFGGNTSFEYSSDGILFTPFSPKREVGQLFNNGWGPAYWYNNCGIFTQADDIKYLKITLHANGSFNMLPCFRYILYNTVNHGSPVYDFDILPISDDEPADLDIPSKKIDFTLGSTYGVAYFDGCDITNNGVNADYIGGENGLITFAGDTSTTIYDTIGIKDFKAVFNYPAGDYNYIEVKAYAMKNNTDPGVEIPLKAYLNTAQPGGWRSHVFRPADRDGDIPADTEFIKIVSRGTKGRQMMSFTHYFVKPDVVPLPDFKTVPQGQYELKDDLSAANLEKERGGLAHEVFQMTWNNINLGGDNGDDKVITKTDFLAEGYIIYEAPQATFLDVRGYRSNAMTDDLLIYVSEDMENWTLLSDFDYYESRLFDGPYAFSYQLNIPENINYIKLEIPELPEYVNDMVISDVQIFHSSNEVVIRDIPEDGDDKKDTDDTNLNDGSDVKTGVMSDNDVIIALLAVAGLTMIMISMCRKETETWSKSRK